MQAFLTFCSCFLLLHLVCGLLLVSRISRRTDRILGVQLMSTVSTALLVVMGEAMDAPVLFDTSLIFALLAAISTVAFVRKAWSREGANS